MGRFIGALLVLLTFASCVSKYPEAIVGVPMTCVTDSTPIVVDTIVRIKAGIVTKENPHPIEYKYKFTECTNTPDSLDLYPFYPSALNLDFIKKTYSFTFSLKQLYETYCNKGFCVKVNFDMGKLDYSAKKSTITLTSEINKWTRTFKYSYNKQDKILTLRSEKVK
jgi:hypothetical protein